MVKRRNAYYTARALHTGSRNNENNGGCLGQALISYDMGMRALTYKIPSPKGECILYDIMPECPCLNQYSIRCLCFILLLMLYTVASAFYIIKLLYNSTVSMVTDAINMLI